MVSSVVRKVILGIGIALLALAVLMLVMAGGGMILMDLPLLLVGGGMVAWAVIQGRKNPS